VAPCTPCKLDTPGPSTDLRRHHVEKHPYLEHKCHMFRHVSRIWTSSMVITKRSGSVTSGHIVCCGFQGKRPEAVSSQLLFSHKLRALSSRYLSHWCFSIFYFIYCIYVRSNRTYNDSFYATIPLVHRHWCIFHT
jgi:hypothetical protein